MGAPPSEGVPGLGVDCAPAQLSTAAGEGAASPSPSDARAPPCTKGIRSAAPANEAAIVRQNRWVLLAEASGRERRSMTAMESNL